MLDIETLVFQHDIVEYGTVTCYYVHFFDTKHNTEMCMDNSKKIIYYLNKNNIKKQ